MEDNYDLPSTLKHGTFSFANAVKAGITRHALRQLLNSGTIRRLTRNQYQYWKREEVRDAAFESACSIIGQPSAICLLSALEFYGLTDEIVEKIWVMVPKNKISRRKEFRLFRGANPRWSIGIIKKKRYWITSLERTLVECLFYQKYLGPFIAIEAIKKSLNEQKTTLLDISNMAKKLDRYKKLRPYFESLL